MSTQPSASDDDEGITKISKNGDVILVVGLEKEKIQVASDFLEHISPVFKAMLNAPMKEGEALRNRAHDSPVTIALPGDCPKAMKHVLRTLYGADDHFESDPSFQTVYDMVTLADKYGMAGRLKLFGANWLRIRTGDEDFHGYDGYWDKFVIACILDDDHAFFQISSILHNVHGEIIEWSLRLPDRELGMRLVLAVEELRSEYRSESSERPPEQGLCLSCFKNVTTSFIIQQDNCDFPIYHDNRGGW